VVESLDEVTKNKKNKRREGEALLKVFEDLAKLKVPVSDLERGRLANRLEVLMGDGTSV
jgi:hypothetical protein